MSCRIFLHRMIRRSLFLCLTQELKTKDEIFSAMVIYGFLSCYDGKVLIPNMELMDQFVLMLRKEESLGYVYRLAAESERMLEATLAEDTHTMEEILEFAHNTEMQKYTGRILGAGISYSRADKKHRCSRVAAGS